MSFMKYLEAKSPPQTKITMEAYKEKLEADLSSFVIKPNQNLVEVKKNIVNLQEVSKILSQLNYPLMDEFNMAMKTGNSKKVSQARSVFHRWAEYSKLDEKLVDRIESIVFQYEINLFSKTFDPDQVDEVVKSSISESQLVIDNIAKQIELAILSIPTWGNYPITIEALYPESGWVISGAKVIIGDTFISEFNIEKSPLGIQVSNLKKENVPASMESDIQALLNKLSNNPKYNKILTLYMTRPESERRFFEIAKRDLSLGIKAVLPNHVTLSTMPLAENQDVWKIRIEEKYLRLSLNEGNYKEFHIFEEAPLKWIELLRKAN